jgi:hypothetical protein
MDVHRACSLAKGAKAESCGIAGVNMGKTAQFFKDPGFSKAEFDFTNPSSVLRFSLRLTM